MKFVSTNLLRGSVFSLFAALLLAAGCDGKRETREILNMPDMHFSPAFKAQEPNPWSPTGTMMLPVEGTVPTHWQPYTITDAEADTKASALQNPLPATPDIVRLGQKYYGVFCISCHGENGDGLGSVVVRNVGMPRPPILYSEKIRNEWTDGRIYHVITNGQGNMWSYASKIDPDKRWAIIHYIRAMGRAHNPEEGDDQIAERVSAQLEEIEIIRDPEGDIRRDY